MKKLYLFITVLFKTIKKIFINAGIMSQQITDFESAFKIPAEYRLSVKIKYQKKKYNLIIDTRNYEDNEGLSIGLICQILMRYSIHMQEFKKTLNRDSFYKKYHSDDNE